LQASLLPVELNLKLIAVTSEATSM
jgi:hypothetical protein